MNVLHLHPASDTAGQSMAGKRALEAAGDSVRVFVRNQHPFGYERATMWDIDAVRESLSWSDVVIVHNDPALYAKVAGPPRPVIVHHHGSRFRGDPVNMWAQGESIGARQIVSTIDLLLSVPAGRQAEWMPQVVDAALMSQVREAHPPGAKLRVTHAPTNRQIKGTRHVIKAMRNLKGEAEFLLIQRQPWPVCLRWKAASHVFIDQLTLGYGNNAIEAWGMGLPVLSGATPDILERMRAEYPLPFFATTAATLEADIRSFLASPEIRAEWAERGRAHVERFHAPEAWVARTRALYAGDPLTVAA